MVESVATAGPSSSVRRTSPTALRPLKAELGTLARSDASASFSLGSVIVVASVSGPTEVRIRDELTDRATLDVIYQPQHGVAEAQGIVLRQNSHMAEISQSQLAGLVRQYKEEQGESDDIEVDDELESNGRKRKKRYSGNTVVLLDPTPLELDYALSTHVFAFAFSQALDGEEKEAAAHEVSEQILAESQGAVDLADLERAHELCLSGSSAVVGFMRAALQKRILSQTQ
ncbi:predicted exosome subunit [Pseudozyma hubeiensis SY62]|uniref:Predicted exosome subunit n=1 Tax=Pseudozyma hubeiensis (strain SY62) TaxID=1305764 RepID=R9P1V7_PSEHS|nr:predicted exosome subunit [Pseudozyma hubeiensis SY62]GAC95246.1 predicted exosome subunit [Pseudozyma hubeiensis SY62]